MVAESYAPNKRKPPLKGVLLYLLPLPLLPAALLALSSGNITRVIGSGVGFALAILGASLVRRGIVIEAESARRKIRRRASRVPYKLIGGLCVAVATGVVTWLTLGKGIPQSVLYSLACFAGSYLYYGFDPARKDPEISAIGITSEEVLDLLEEAEKKILGIEASRKKISNRELNDRLRSIIKGARKILTIIEEDPRDARRARKFLRVYLDGAQQVTEGYARTHTMGDSPELEENFRRVLGTIETVIEEQQQKLLENNLSELDVNIEVLQMQLEKEGVI
ncbi:MAG: 5-bromo-4-chloroindolyl phosphate hydrolysis family protein [Gammaproteobacteria bacterium]|nr:5-bromo-4-chloroindolyl phosphate hydrolysis family protein [Gammaproteobacteria bacterium]